MLVVGISTGVRSMGGVARQFARCGDEGCGGLGSAGGSTGGTGGWEAACSHKKDVITTCSNPHGDD